MKSTILKTGFMLLSLGVLVAPMVGCRGDRSDATPRRFFPDLDDQQKWDPQETSEFFADGMVARQTPEHAVAFASVDFDPVFFAGEPWAAYYLAEREAMLAEDDAVYRGVRIAPDGGEEYLDDIPVAVTRRMVEHGRDMYNIYCVSCHGYAGDGKGMVGLRWNYPPANLTSDVYRDRSGRQGKDGYLFYTIRNGLVGPDGANRMPGYGHALDEMDSWAVVAYIRALQRSRGVDWADLSPADQAELGEPTPPVEEQPTDGGES